MKNDEKVKLSPAMREVLEQDDAEPIAGNVMARTINVTCGGGFTGMSYGWADEDEDAIAFVVRLVEAVDEDPEREDWGDEADSAVPIYTDERWRVGARLRDLIDDDEVRAMSDGSADITELLGVGLYLLASQILGVLASELAEVRENLDDEDQ